MNFNKVIIIGTIASELDLNTTPDGHQAMTFSVGIKKKWKDDDGIKQEKIEYVSVVARDNTAETIKKWCNRGDEILVEGELRTRSYIKEGIKTHLTEVKLNRFSFGQKKVAENNDFIEYGY